ncbi:glycogen synthase GlgA [Candidatus Sumerlaeota bacterium]|nr:glycogen synthase GlgA [Candidatus Sumerlaeota bacterium]
MPEKKYRILFVSSEMAPYAKTGGLADVVAGLSRCLGKRGHEVRVVLPFYRAIRDRTDSIETFLPSMCVRMGDAEEWCAVRRVRTEHNVTVYFVDHDHFFNRPGLYHDGWMRDYDDNPRRFAFLSRAALQICMDGGFEPDLIHCNDWQTALIPGYLRSWFWNHPFLGRAASVLTIHNVAYQGKYPVGHYSYLGLGAENFVPERFEDHGGVNFLKGGVGCADAVNTVSPGHAREITAPGQGFGLAPYLSNKNGRFRGILNGVDYDLWEPSADLFLPAPYNVEDRSGKTVCKRALQEAFQLDPSDNVCVVGAIGRFVHQKGYDLICEAIEPILRDMAVQFVILGSGSNGIERFFGTLPARYPGRVGSYIGYNDARSHLIEAGCDFFLMPSRFEPCGLNQLYSLRYGTLPIVRATGGLCDTVEQYDEQTGEGTGFMFDDPTPRALYDTVGWAVSTYYDRPRHVEQLAARAMRQDFSWEKSAVEYEDLYRLALSAKADYDRSHAV